MSSQTGEKLDTSTTGKHIPAVDGVRGLAVLLVLAHHLFASNPVPGGNIVVRFLAAAHSSAWAGVDLFFVLSGFLITGILYDTLPAPHFFRNFYARRSLRIFPLYYGFLLLLVLIAALRSEHWTRALFEYFGYFENLLLHHIPYTDAKWININHFWSLQIEEQFYLLWPMMIWLLRTRRRIAIAALCGVALSLSVRIAWHLHGLPPGNVWVMNSWTPSHLDGLFLGATLAMMVRSSLRNLVLRLWPAMVVAGAVPCAYAWHQHGFLELSPAINFDIWGITALSVLCTGLLAGALRSRAMQWFFSTHTLRFFGRYSYGIYVYHFTILTVFTRLLRPHIAAHTLSKAAPIMVIATVTFLVTVGIAWLSFHYFERPFLSLKSRFESRGGRERLDEVIAGSGPA